MSPFIIDALEVGLKEGLKLALVWHLSAAVLRGDDNAERGRSGLWFWGAVMVSGIAALTASAWIAPGLATKEFLGRLSGYVFGLFYLAGVMALLTHTDNRIYWRWHTGPFVLVSAFVYFIPDALGGTIYLAETLRMSGASWPEIHGGGGLGFALTLAASMLILGRLRWRPGAYLDLPRMLLTLALIKLLAGGTRGFSEFSLIPAVQAGVMKFVHDFVHQTFVFLLVPDHPLLKTTTWNFIGFLFGPNFGIGITFALLTGPVLAALAGGLFAPYELQGAEEMSGAQRRLAKASMRAMRLRHSLPLIAFVCVVVAAWYAGGSEQAHQLYNPAPKPVISDKGVVVIPLTDPTMNLMDGKLHKFSIAIGGEAVRFMAIKRPDGELSVCLDACDICPPEGYGQTEGNVVCIYCLTPIPLGSVGISGGCNPIPLEASITADEIRISVEELGGKWMKMKAGLSK